MAETTEISWTDHTLNLWWGCAKVHAGCDHCYAEAFAHRYGHEIWGPKAPRKASKSAFKDVLKYQRKAAADGVIRRVFVGSMMDIFEKPFPLIDSKGAELPETTGHLRQRFFEEVVPACPNLLFLLLTKRPGNILKYIPESWKTTPPANVMYGTSVVDQATADDMIPKLLEVPGRHFLSMEPLIGPVALLGETSKAENGLRWSHDWLTGHETTISSIYGGDHAWLSRDIYERAIISNKMHRVDWVIVGGESGHGARPMHPKWAQDIRDECAKTEVPFHFKQWGEWMSDDPNILWESDPRECFVRYSGHSVGTAPGVDAEAVAHIGKRGHGPTEQMIYVGKKRAGNLLDGKLHQDVPTI